MKSRVQLHTFAIESISFKAFSTCTVEAAISVSTVCIGIACMCPQFTLINICKNWRKYHVSSSHSGIIVYTDTVVITLFYSKAFFLRTHAVDSISSVARIAGAGITPLCVCAVCILMTVVQVINLALIDICTKQKCLKVSPSIIVICTCTNLVPL